MERLPCTLLWIALLAASASAGEEPGPIPWLGSLDAALAQARDAGKPILLHYVPTRGRGAREMDDATADPAVREALDRFVRVRLDPATGPEVASRFGMDLGFRIFPPVRIYLDAEGRETDRGTGLPATAPLLEELRTVLATGGRYRTATVRLEATPDDDATRLERFRWAAAVQRWDLVAADGAILRERLDANPRLEEVLLPYARAETILAAPAGGAADAGRLDRALTAAQAYLERFPAGAAADEALGQAAYLETLFGRDEDAARLYARLLRDHPRSDRGGAGRDFFRDRPDLAAAIGFDARAVGAVRRRFDETYDCVPSADAFARADAEGKWVLVWQNWPG